MNQNAFIKRPTRILIGIFLCFITLPNAKGGTIVYRPTLFANTCAGISQSQHFDSLNSEWRSGRSHTSEAAMKPMDLVYQVYGQEAKTGKRPLYTEDMVKSLQAEDRAYPTDRTIYLEERNSRTGETEGAMRVVMGMKETPALSDFYGLLSHRPSQDSRIPIVRHYPKLADHLEPFHVEIGRLATRKDVPRLRVFHDLVLGMLNTVFSTAVERRLRGQITQPDLTIYFSADAAAAKLYQKFGFEIAFQPPAHGLEKETVLAVKLSTLIDRTLAWQTKTLAKYSPQSKIGDPLKALDELSVAFSEHPYASAFHTGLMVRSQVLFDLKQFAEARTDAEKLLRLIPDHPEAQVTALLSIYQSELSRLPATEAVASTLRSFKELVSANAESIEASSTKKFIQFQALITERNLTSAAAMRIEWLNLDIGKGRESEFLNNEANTFQMLQYALKSRSPKMTDLELVDVLSRLTETFPHGFSPKLRLWKAEVLKRLGRDSEANAETELARRLEEAEASLSQD